MECRGSNIQNRDFTEYQILLRNETSYALLALREHGWTSPSCVADNKNKEGKEGTETKVGDESITEEADTMVYGNHSCFLWPVWWISGELGYARISMIAGWHPKQVKLSSMYSTIWII